MIAQKYKVIVGYGELGGVDPKFLEQKGIKVEFIPIHRGGVNIIKDLKTFFYIWNFFKKEEPDIVHLVTIKPYLYGGFIARLVGIPSLVSAVSGLGSIFIHKNLKSKFLQFLLYPMFRIAFNHKNQIIIIQNQEDSRRLIDWGV